MKSVLKIWKIPMVIPFRYTSQNEYVEENKMIDGRRLKFQREDFASMQFVLLLKSENQEYDLSKACS